MYLERLRIKNFRILKDADLFFQGGINLLLGENDSGKSAVVDAIRLLLGTRDYERVQVMSDDFYVNQNGRAQDFQIMGTFRGISDEEAALFLEWVTIEGTNPDGSLNYVLEVRLLVVRKEEHELTNKYDRLIRTTWSAGLENADIQLTQEARDLLRVTYLKPLRDAELELAARRGSRLSQILLRYPAIRQQDSRDSNSIPGIVREANSRVKNHPAVLEPITSLNQDYLANFTLGDTSIQASVDISNPSIRAILEHLELTLTDGIPDADTKHGLGLNNLLFMATELLLLQSENGPAPLVIIEEPEAHLHPQFQLRLMSFLEEQAHQSTKTQVQVIMTSHSPNLASKVPTKQILMLKNGLAFSLEPKYTKLDDNDYRFLQNFLDVTKANLFFARGVILVEGDAEQIILPTIANLIGKPLEKFGVSIVNVGHVGLFRYARIFQRTDNINNVGIPVACLTDLDIPSPEAKNYLHRDKKGRLPKTHSEFCETDVNTHRAKKIARASGGCVQTFVSPVWTLEYDVCLHNSSLALLLHQAILWGKASDSSLTNLSDQKICKIKTTAIKAIESWKSDGLTNGQISACIYKPLYKKSASKVTTAYYFRQLLDESFTTSSIQQNRALFPSYLVEAIDYVTS